jgi:hypothetical protein
VRATKPNPWRRLADGLTVGRAVLGLPLIAILALAGPVGVNGLAFPRLTGPLYEHYLTNKAAPKPSSTP